MTLNAMVARQLLAAGLDPEDTERAVRAALEEDLRYGPDVTSAATAAPDARAVAGVMARQPGSWPAFRSLSPSSTSPAFRPGQPSHCAVTATGSTPAPKSCASTPR